MTIATIAAAIAAALSVVAAFRQEAATFNSQLFSKEVDTSSAWIETSDALMILVGEGYYRKLNSKNDFADLASDQRDLAEIEMKIAQLGEKTSELRLLASLNMGEMSVATMRAVMPLINIYKAKSEDEYKKRAIDASNGQGLALTASSMSERLSNCVGKQFSQGKPIYAPDVEKCIGGSTKLRNSSN